MAASAVLKGFPRMSGICRLVDSSAVFDTKVQFLTAKMPQMNSFKSAERKDLETRKVLTNYVEEKDHHCTRVVNVYLGEEAKLTEASLRSGAHSAVQHLKELKAKAAQFLLPKLDSITPERAAYVVQQAVSLKNYSFSKYITKEDARPSFFETFAIVSDGKLANDAELEAVCNATIFARDLANERADVANPQFLEEIAHKVAGECGLEMHVLNADELKKQGLNLLYAVGQAARHGPRLIALEYKGGAPTAAPLMLVGKGITYDTGGLNIKPTGSMENMHMDMSGAAVTLATMQAVAKLKLHRNVVGILAVAENAIDGLAYKPYDIIQSHKGLTVRVNNTDAEGRLALADALSYGQQRYNPSQVIDIATLTGACVVALGEHAAGLFCEQTFERLWPLPIFSEHSDELKGVHADIYSTGEAGKGGSCTAAAFLKAFIDEHRPWAHLDIAGPGMYSKDNGHFIAGGTGFGVQLLTAFAKQKST